MVKEHILRQFHDAWMQTEFGPLPVNIPKPSVADVAHAADILANAKRPLLIMGSQATLPPIKPDQLVQTVNVIRCLLIFGVTKIWYFYLFVLETRNTRLFGWNESWTVGHEFSIANAPKSKTSDQGCGRGDSGWSVANNRETNESKK